MILLLHNLLYLKLLYLLCKALYHEEVSYITICYSLDIYTCVYIYMYRIEMYCTVDCVHEISLYRYRSKIVYRDITSDW